MATEIDLDQLGAVFVGIGEQFEKIDYTERLTKVAEDLERDHQHYFEQDQSPVGEPWQPLSPVTITRKGHDTILEDTRAMRKSLQRGSTGNVLDIDSTGSGDTFLVFGTADEKAPFHQHGTTRIPARPFVGVTPERTDEIVEQIADATVEGLQE